MVRAEIGSRGNTEGQLVESVGRRGGKRAAVLGAVPVLRRVPPVAGFIKDHRLSKGSGKEKQALAVEEASKPSAEKEFDKNSLLEIDMIFAEAQLEVSKVTYMGSYPDQLRMAREALRKIQMYAERQIGENGVQKDGGKQVQVGLFEGRENDFAEIMSALGIKERGFVQYSGEGVKSYVVKIGETSNMQTSMRGVYGKAIKYMIMDTPYISFDIIFSPEAIAIIAQSQTLPPLEPVKK